MIHRSVSETQCNLVKQADGYALRTLGAYAISQRKPLGAKGGKYAHHTHATVATNVIDGGIMWDRTIHVHFGVVDYAFICSSISRCRSVICHSFKLNMLGPIPAGQLAQRCGTVWSCLSCSSQKGLWWIWRWGKETRQTPKQFRLTIPCLRLIQGGAPQLCLLACKPHQL